MKTQMLKTLILAAMSMIPMAVAGGCAQEISHTETDKPGMFGGHKHEETTVYKNPDGSLSVDHEKKTTSP